ncbi:hypothetical protein EDB86DRAFT_3251409 [Lactarius hatsudake]|nr:hypothetical protein EDB86DRAFT_3251409 [Lactarius hatsudake]
MTNRPSLNIFLIFIPPSGQYYCSFLSLVPRCYPPSQGKHVQAIRKCKPKVAQSSLVGSIISNQLLILGISIFIGGIRYSEQTFGKVAAQVYTTLLTMAVASLLLPTLLYKSINSTATDTFPILAISRAQITHRKIWGKNDPSIEEPVEYAPQVHRMIHTMSRKRTVAATTSSSSNPHPPNASPIESDNDRLPQVLVGPSASSKERLGYDKPQMCLSVAIATFVLTFLAIFYIGGALITSIDDLAPKIQVSEEFVSLIIFPLFGNVDKFASAVGASFKDKSSKVLAVAVGSSIETALLIFPFTTILSWILGKPLALLFDTFEAVVLFLSVVIVNNVVKDGKSNWLEGMILVFARLQSRGTPALGNKYYSTASIQQSVHHRQGWHPHRHFCARRGLHIAHRREPTRRRDCLSGDSSNADGEGQRWSSFKFKTRTMPPSSGAGTAFFTTGFGAVSRSAGASVGANAGTETELTGTSLEQSKGTVSGIGAYSLGAVGPDELFANGTKSVDGAAETAEGRREDKGGVVRIDMLPYPHEQPPRP